MIDPLLISDLLRSHEYQMEWTASNAYIYGTGSFALTIHRLLQQNGINILGFIDHQKVSHENIQGTNVFSPDDFLLHPELCTNSSVVLGIHNREANAKNIISRLRQAGFARVVTPIDLYDDFGHTLENRYWLTSRKYYGSHRPEIEYVFEMFSDEMSRKTFSSLLRFRITADYSLLPRPDMEHQYFPIDLPAWRPPMRFIDCGAYDGDTIKSLIKAGYEFEAIAAFEPDLENFRKLSSFASNRLKSILNMALYPCGVHSETTQLMFESGNGEASTISQAGSTVVTCVSLDECIPAFKPSLIKMDIEGAEPDALRGATKLIRDSQPVLAISVYHSPGHLWEIPLQIDQISRQYNLRYSYHLRAHGHNCFDTIFYAIPIRSS